MTSKTLSRNHYFKILALEGVRHFPLSSNFLGEANSQTQSSHSGESILASKVTNCTSCLLHRPGETPRVSAPWTTKPYFVLLDSTFNFEDSKQAPSSPETTLLNLLSKLGISEKSHLSWAVRCNVSKGIPFEAQKACAVNLELELEAILPTHVLVFGSKSLESLQMVFKNQNEEAVSAENSGFYATLEVKKRGETIKVIVLPSLLELEVLPQWRQEVWKQLKTWI